MPRHLVLALFGLVLVHCASAVIPSTADDAGPRSCQSDHDCPHGLSCNGTPGCGTAWQCVDLLCVNGPSTWCDCAGNTFTSTDGCAHRPYAHAGTCELPTPVDAGTCTPMGAVCQQTSECCAGACEQFGSPIFRCGIPHPTPRDTFPCGALNCGVGVEYCEMTFSDVPTPDSTSCQPIPAACNGTATCGCITHHPCDLGCQMAADGTIDLHCPGG